MCIRDRIYTEPCPFLKSGARGGRENDNPCYTVKYTEHWDDYSMALLDEIPQAVQDSNVNISTGAVSYTHLLRRSSSYTGVCSG